MLLSKDSIKLLKVKLDLENDVAEIFGVPPNLDCSLFDHYLTPSYGHDADIDTFLVVNNENERDEIKIIKLCILLTHLYMKLRIFYRMHDIRMKDISIF